MNCKKCGNLLKSGDVFCRKCEAPVDVETQSIPSGVPTSQPIVTGISQKQNKQSLSSAIMIALIVIIAIGIVSLLIWQLVFGGTKGKFSYVNDNSEVRKILKQKKSNYSLIGTWEGFMVDSVLEITINDSNKCTINAFDDFWDYDINTIEAEITNGNILRMYSKTVQGPYTELRTDKYPVSPEFYLVAISKDKFAMIPKKGSEYLSEKMISHKISTDKGLLGKWKPDEEEDSFGTLVFTDQERCDFDSSNKCYKIIKNSDTMKEVLYYDNDFIYIYMPDNFNPSDGVPASVERWYDKLFGIMTYELNGDELTFSFAMLFNRLSK